MTSEIASLTPSIRNRFGQAIDGFPVFRSARINIVMPSPGNPQTRFGFGSRREEQLSVPEWNRAIGGAMDDQQESARASQHHLANQSHSTSQGAKMFCRDSRTW